MTALDFREIATVLEYLDGKTQALPHGVSVDFQHETSAPMAEPQPPAQKPGPVLVRAPCPGRVQITSAAQVVREGETIAEVLCGRRRVPVLAPAAGTLGVPLFQSGQFVEFDQVLAILNNSVKPETTSADPKNVNTSPAHAGEGREA